MPVVLRHHWAALVSSHLNTVCVATTIWVCGALFIMILGLTYIIVACEASLVSHHHYRSIITRSHRVMAVCDGPTDLRASCSH